MQTDSKTTKLFIEVRGGMIQNIQSTSPDVILFVKDYDNVIPDDEQNADAEKEDGWQYWEAKPDMIVDEDEFEDTIVNSDNG